MERIYLDHNATTMLDPRVREAMEIDLDGPPANPSSLHWFGRRARQLLYRARSTVASFFQAKPEEIIFTSGGTESLNTFLRGIDKKGHLITSEIEHSSIYRTAKTLEKEGLSVTYLPVDLWGAPRLEQIADSIHPDTSAIALSAANAETGIKIDLERIASLAEERQIPLLIDAVAFVGKEHLIPYPGISAIAISAHKFHGPKGVGVLFCRSSCPIEPLLIGGGQESLHRAGTENLAGILGLAKALEILMEEQDKISEKLLTLRHHFEEGLKKEIPDLLIHGKGPRVANTANIAFPGVDGETLLMQLDLAGIAASHGSACASGALEPSRVLTQMGVERSLARSSLRFSFGRTNTLGEISRAIPIITQLAQKLSSRTNPAVS